MGDNDLRGMANLDPTGLVGSIYVGGLLNIASYLIF